ncbi:MAG: hypothetical protein DRO00_02895 [Thermoproteota archaeon]|nr:MAG: hypothetical protein DRO00_02895 [Candidatus Korarchaeota archaeon]
MGGRYKTRRYAKARNHLSLAFIQEGKKARVIDIFGGRGMVRRLMEMGLSPGSEVIVVRNSLGPMIIEVRGVRLALGRGLASRILVEPVG